MKRKLLLTIVFAISGIILVNAQCTNVVYTMHGIHPDSLRHADATVPYHDTLTLIVPTDTVISSIPVTIDSVSLDSISHLPSGFIATPNAAYWHGGHTGCIYITGTPTHTQAGVIDSVYLNIMTYIQFYTSLGTVGWPVDTLTLTVYNNTDGVIEYNNSKFSLSQNSPNPFSLNTIINFTSPDAENCQFTVYNVLGDIVYRQPIAAKTGMNTIQYSAANLPSGIYLYKLSNAVQTITRRMIVEGR
ncbi:MAG: T9SS type A sorting domain-containing protein [Bacteroidales bacterium]|jgi:hypothetical protein